MKKAQSNPANRASRWKIRLWIGSFVLVGLFLAGAFWLEERIPEPVGTVYVDTIEAGGGDAHTVIRMISNAGRKMEMSRFGVRFSGERTNVVAWFLLDSEDLAGCPVGVVLSPESIFINDEPLTDAEAARKLGELHQAGVLTDTEPRVFLQVDPKTGIQRLVECLEISTRAGVNLFTL